MDLSTKIVSLHFIKISYARFSDTKGASNRIK